MLLFLNIETFVISVPKLIALMSYCCIFCSASQFSFQHSALVSTIRSHRASLFIYLSHLIIRLAREYDWLDTHQVQGGFYLVGGGFLDWTTLMRQMFKEVHGNTTNVATYIGPGSAHCQDADDVFYTDVVRALSLVFLSVQFSARSISVFILILLLRSVSLAIMYYPQVIPHVYFSYSYPEPFFCVIYLHFTFGKYFVLMSPIAVRATLFFPQSNGVMLYQWVNDLINGAPTLQSAVDCAPNC